MKKQILKLTIGTMILSSTLLADMDRCVSCHGVDFEKKALGISKVVKGMSEDEIKKSLDNYKIGIGGPAKSIMMKEVNVGVDTDAMAADIFNEIQTPGFEEPNDEFIFQKRLSVKTLQKIKLSLKKAKKEDMKKISSQIKAAAFSMYTYDTLLQTKIDFKSFKAKKLTKKDILDTVVKAKKCVDHSFTEEEIVKCRVDFVNLAGTLTQNEAKKMKKNMKKAPIFKGEGAVNLDKYIKN
jgi:cytochrome c553